MKRVLAPVLGLLMVLSTPSGAAADAPGPTDYRTEVVAIEPSTGAFEVEIIGGDSFVLLRQLEPSDILILGYRGEPYLRFSPDGTVEQNLRSPAVYLNEERYGDDDELPPEADPTADPEWGVVADGGSYAWHDHRAHWMLRSRPFGKEPGDQILEGVIPVFVDDREVDITVASYWQDGPSPLPFVAGTVIGAAAVAVVWRRRSTTAAGAVTAAGALALLVGWVQFASVPAETGPSTSLVLLPGVAVLTGLAAIVTRRRPATALPLAIGGASALLVFGAVRLPTSNRAILPTDLPFALDRGAGVVVTLVGAGVLVAAASELSRLLQGRPAEAAR